LVFSILLVELEERRRGFAKLNATYKALADEFWTEEGPSHFERWGVAMQRMDAEVATAESLAKRMAAETQPRSNVLSRLLRPYDASSFLSAGKQYNNFIIHWLTQFRFYVPTESSKIKRREI